MIRNCTNGNPGPQPKLFDKKRNVMRETPTLYIGVYLECKNEKIPHTTYNKACCNKTYKLDESFCSSCGKVLVPIKQKDGHESRISARDVQDECDDVFSPVNLDCQTDIDLFLGNREGLGNFYEVKEMEGTSAAVPITPRGITDATHALINNDEAAAAYAIIKSHYGKEGVTTRYGAVIYFT